MNVSLAVNDKNIVLRTPIDYETVKNIVLDISVNGTDSFGEVFHLATNISVSVMFTGI